MNQFTTEQRALLEEIWRISEEGWHAGWMANIEFELWTIIQSGPAKCGQLEIDFATIKNLKQLSNKANGWFYWDKIDQETWVDTESWLKMYKRSQNPTV